MNTILSLDPASIGAIATAVGGILTALGALIYKLISVWSTVRKKSTKELLQEENKELLNTVNEAFHEFGTAFKTQSELLKEALANKAKANGEDTSNVS